MSIRNNKRRKIVLICMGCLAFLGCGVAYFYWVGDSKTSETSETVTASSNEVIGGRWRTVNKGLKKRSTFEEMASKLTSLPYLQGYKKAPVEQGVTVYEKELAYDGFNLYNSGHAAEAGIMDMQGNIIHKWTFDITKLGYSGPRMEASVQMRRMWKDKSSHWRRVYLYDNGDIIVMYSYILMIKLDKDSNLLGVLFKRQPHHHMQVGENGNIYVLSAKSELVPEINMEQRVMNDYITILSPKGEIVKEHSLFRCFANSDYAYILNNMRRTGELFHTNTIEVFDGRLSHISPLFKKGNVLVASLYLNSIAIVDLDKNRVVWALKGSENDMWDGMHEPVLLENGNILLFDNHWAKEGITGHSKIIEFNPFTRGIVWQYKGSEEHPFYSRTCGTNQRLPNGNTLITESDNGRAFEVTKDGTIVWEYVSPHRAGENSELIATLLHLDRIDRDRLKWLLPR